MELARGVSRPNARVSAVVLVGVQQDLVDDGAGILLHILDLIVVDGIILRRAQLGLIL